LFGKLFGIIFLREILVCALNIFQQACENTQNILLQTSPSLCSQYGGARCHWYVSLAIMVFMGELGMKVTKQSLKQCKMAIETAKHRGTKLTTCPQDDLYSILKCFSYH